MIAVQLIDSTGRVLGNMRLPASVRLADLDRLALAADRPSLSDHIEPRIVSGFPAAELSLELAGFPAGDAPRLNEDQARAQLRA